MIKGLPPAFQMFVVLAAEFMSFGRVREAVYWTLIGGGLWPRLFQSAGSEFFTPTNLSFFLRHFRLTVTPSNLIMTWGLDHGRLPPI
jgi:hypothetical protein